MKRAIVIAVMGVIAVLAIASITSGVYKEGNVLRRLPVFSDGKGEKVWKHKNLDTESMVGIPSNTVPKIDGGTGQKDVSGYMDAPFYGISFPDDKKEFTSGIIATDYLAFMIKDAANPATVQLSMVSAPELRGMDVGREEEYRALIDKINSTKAVIDGYAYTREPAPGYPGQFEDGGDYYVRTLDDPYVSSLGVSPDARLVQKDIFMAIGDIPAAFTYFTTRGGKEDVMVAGFINSIKPLKESYITKAVSYGGAVYPGDYKPVTEKEKNVLSNPPSGLFAGVKVAFIECGEKESYINENNAGDILGIDTGSAYMFPDENGNLRVRAKRLSYIIVNNPDSDIQTVVSYPSYQEKYADMFVGNDADTGHT